MTDRSERELQAAADRALGQDLSDLITHGREAAVSLPEPSADVTVKTSLKLPPGLHQRVKAAAESAARSRTPPSPATQPDPR
jgi:hypothetical protein